jgi:dipeptidyl aminopeptidase/acylaminoacyl peptidase
VTAADPVAALLVGLDEPVAPAPEFAERLYERLRPELAPAPAAAAPQRLRALRRRRLLLAVAAAGLALAAVATATYYTTRDAAPAAVQRGGVTGPFTALGDQGLFMVPSVGTPPRARKPVVVRNCPRTRFCGWVSSYAWSPDGRRLAFALTSIHRRGNADGIHVLDTATGREAWFEDSRLGCVTQFDLAWLPDGSGIAYACATSIHVVDTSGRDRMLRGVRRRRGLVARVVSGRPPDRVRVPRRRPLVDRCHETRTDRAHGCWRSTRGRRTGRRTAPASPTAPAAEASG